MPKKWTNLDMFLSLQVYLSNHCIEHGPNYFQIQVIVLHNHGFFFLETKTSSPNSPDGFPYSSSPGSLSPRPGEK